MIQPLDKILNTRIVGNGKLIVIALLFVCALVYAFSAMRGFVYDSEYSRTLSFQSLKLDKSKEYLFVKEYKISTSPNTVIIPLGRVNMPDSLCTLFYDGEWKLKLTDNLRKNHKDNNKETIFYPFCRLNKVVGKEFLFSKKFPFLHLEDKFRFFSDSMPSQKDLLIGIRFNNASGGDAFVIKIEEQNDTFFLTKGVAFFTNRNVPISNTKRNVIELDYCINGDTLGNSKYVFSFPFLGSNHQPERKNIIIENDKINYNGTFQAIEKDDFTFSIYDCVFRLKSNYNVLSKWLILPLFFLIIVGFSVLMLWRLFVLTNKTLKPEQRNLIKVEQFNILSLRLLFNCIILLGFPILLLKTQTDGNRLLYIFLLAIILNINWIAVKEVAKKTINRIVKKIKPHNNFFRMSLILLVVFTFIAAAFVTTNELVFGLIPVLKVTFIIFVFLPFLVDKISLQKLHKMKWFNIFFKDKEHDSLEIRNKEKEKFIFNLICYFLFIVSTLVIAIFSSDSATFIFTALGVFLILIINFKRFHNLILPNEWEQDKKWWGQNKKIRWNFLSLLILSIVFVIGMFGFPFLINSILLSIILGILIIIAIAYTLSKIFKSISTPLKEITIAIAVLSLISGAILSEKKDEKAYRIYSFLRFPDNNQFDTIPNINIEGSRETIAGQIFLLNSVNNDFNPDFNTVILPEFKSIFFSDYAVLWSFKTGKWLWFILYLGVLTMLAYTIISLLIILGKPIKLKTEKKGYYNPTITIGLNMMLAIMLVQYFYTFLTNFWSLPLTGQSPGLISPSYIEYFFHIILINYLYIYLVSSVENRQNIIRNTDINSKTLSYTLTKRKSIFVPFIIFVGSIFVLFFKQDKINDYIQLEEITEKKVKQKNAMYWKIVREHNLDTLSSLKKDTLLILAYESFGKMEDNVEEQRKFRNYLFAYYESDNIKKEHTINTNYIQKNTNIDSVARVKELDTRGYYKYINGNSTIFIKDKYYGGCPPDAKTIDFKLQSDLNKKLETWAAEINASSDALFIMIAGSILVVENETGEIRASASYPLMYNENLYHFLYKNKELNDSLEKHRKESWIREEIKMRYENSDYVNFSEFVTIPGSIVKPLLVYAGLNFSPGKYKQDWLNEFLGQSNNDKAKDMYKDLFVDNDSFNEAKIFYQNDFGVMPFSDENIIEKTWKSHAIGQQHPLAFKNIVQAYTRIKTGKKIKLTYEKLNTTLVNLSLDSIQLNSLREAMKRCLMNGTASDIGAALKISNKGYLAKTGTAQITNSKSSPYNRTSAFIIVTDEYTIGIQLYGVVPGNRKEKKQGQHAKDLFKILVEEKIINL